MNKLEDTLIEVQAAFEKEYERRFGHVETSASFRAEVAHFFIAGRDSVKPVKAKRYIDRVMFEGKETYAISNDGRLYRLVREAVRWVEYPDLPQS